MKIIAACLIVLFAIAMIFALSSCVTTVAPTGVVMVAPDAHTVDVLAKEWRRQHPAAAKPQVNATK